MAAVPVRRVKWRPKFSLIGIGGGVLGALGLLVVLQQRALVFPTTIVGIATLVGGILFGVAVPSLGRLVAVRRVNRALAAAGVRARPAATELREPPPPAAPAPDAPPPAPVDVATAARVDEVPPAPVGQDPPPPPPPPDEAPPAPPPEDAAPAWTPTHRVPDSGMPAWANPDFRARPVAQLDPGLEVRVLASEGRHAHILCSNGWEAWVDARLLEPLG